MRVIQVSDGVPHLSKDGELRAICGASTKDFMPYEVASVARCKRCLAISSRVAHYLSESGLITAYAGDGDPYDPADDKTTIIATATRTRVFRPGGALSPMVWVVRSATGHASDPIPTRKDALAELRKIVVETAHRYA
jgi:hypothetical protein